MKRRKNKQQTVVNNTDLTKSLNDLSLDQLTSLQNILPNLLDSKIQQMTSSNDLNEIMKANLYLDSLNKRQSSGIKAFFFDPNNAVNAGRGYKENVYYGSLPFSVLRRMGDIFVVRAVVNTRIEQVQNYLHFSLDEQKNGYTVRKKRDFFNDSNLNDVSEEDQKKIEYIKNFLEMGGLNEKWDSFDTFQDFGRKIVFDSLTLDQLAFEITRDNSWNLSRFQAIDASTIRLLDSIDPRCREEFEQYRYKGYLPKYCMVWDGQIVRNPITEESVVFYPWELGYGVRNKSTSIWKSGYGTSELETLVNILTGILYSFDYNFNYFKQGSMPKGFINVKNPNISNSTLNEFRQAFQQTMRGVSNAHKTPVINGIDLEWIDLQRQSNRDMEFTDWMKFLLMLTCAVYRMDPSELGFQFKDQALLFGQDGQKERLDHSKEKGLKPILIFIQNIINHYIVSEIDENFEFVFTGLDVEDEEKQVALDKTKLESGMVAMQDIFEKYSGRKLDENNDIILNQTYQNIKQAEQQAAMYGSEMAGMGGEVGVEEEVTEDPYAQYEKSLNSNPILGAALEYIDRNWGERK